MSDENTKKMSTDQKILELYATLEKELTALLAHPLVPDEFKRIFEDRK